MRGCNQSLVRPLRGHRLEATSKEAKSPRRLGQCMLSVKEGRSRTKNINMLVIMLASARDLQGSHMRLKSCESFVALSSLDLC